jgi:hypothetical protein
MRFEVDFVNPTTGETKHIIGGLIPMEVDWIRAHACCEEHYPLQLNAHALARAYENAPPGFFHRQETFTLVTVH